MVPLCNPTQVQSHGPLPVTAEAVPLVQRFDAGAVVKLFVFAVPQAPFNWRFAEHCAVVPPSDPVQFQVHGPVPLTVEALPALQRFVLGAVRKFPVFAEPHMPLIPYDAEHCTVVPPPDPWQLQFHGPLPIIGLGAPALQR